MGTDLDAGMVSTVIAKTILHDHREPAGKTAFQWTPFIDHSIQDEMIDAYLNNPVDLKQMEKLMSQIDDLKNSSAMKLSFELDRKIRRSLNMW